MTAESREIKSIDGALAPTVSVTDQERNGIPASEELQPSLSRLRMHRICVGAIFFMHGLCFASWASRIPSIQEKLSLTAATLGTVLFALPVGFFISLPFAGWFVGKVGSKKVVVLSAVLYALSLVSIGTASQALELFFCLFSFGFFANLLNISINTQAIAVERLYKKKLMASFHGLWSLAGFTGAAVGTWMIGNGFAPFPHYVVICMVFLLANVVCSFYLVTTDEGQDEKRPLFAMPDKSLIGLGIIAFCSMMAEGAMFDWSGVYFIKVVKVKQEFTGLGYTTFMIAMAGMRFMADGLSHRFGLKKILQASGMLTTAGLLVAVLMPQMLTSLVGFFLIGMGVSSVVPLVYSAAGKSKTLSPGTALTAVSSLGFMGLLIGPPIIGFIAEATSLRISFLAITIMALAVVAFSSRMREEPKP
ncbi:Fucose permease [Chryseolinea serpens]|uniref:Fucose permease n=1 Tax=Chryseolinea serpens TaxID=947013 RepID=A0A1M5M7X9_9BACT|nr:MFS transporter [Chryseolinea serpens]SHG73069.1 Fucose permease [Chryseolinea serpens]